MHSAPPEPPAAHRSRRQVLANAAAGCLAAALPVAHATTAARQTLRVGPGGDYLSPSAAARALAGRGPVQVFIDAGTYQGDVAVWQNCDVIIEGVGGPVVLDAQGQSAEGKAIWVVRQSRMRVQGITFTGCRVRSRNGAGIRLEADSELHVEGCRFLHNENGILTGNDSKSRLTVARTEFGHNGAGDGQSHNLYVGSIFHFSMTACYSHHALVGHLVKSRAAENRIRYNRLSDEIDGNASYELDLPSGGSAVVVGNILQQSPGTENPHVISFGAEGLKWPRNELFLAHNTLVDLRSSGGVPLKLSTGTVSQIEILAWNNLLHGFGSVPLSIGPFEESRGNHRVRAQDFITSGEYRWQLVRGVARHYNARAVDTGSRADLADALRPDHEYLHPLQLSALKGPIRTIGAYPTAS